MVYQMNFRDIEYFAVLAEHGHVGRAAEALGLSQPALSVSLRRLEQSMNAKLCKRTPKGIELTDVGQVLLSQVRRLRQTREDVMREIADLSQGRSGNLRIGAHAVVTEKAAFQLRPVIPLRVACVDSVQQDAGVTHLVDQAQQFLNSLSQQRIIPPGEVAPVQFYALRIGRVVFVARLVTYGAGAMVVDADAAFRRVGVDLAYPGVDGRVINALPTATCCR